MIFTITHKIFEDSYLDRDHYIVLHVGRNSDCKNIYLRDDIGDNISEKNSSYCELTGLYWIWKNYESSDDEITGIVHYRRYFTSVKDDILYTYFSVHASILKYNEIEKALKKADIVLPKREKIYRTIYEYYNDNHCIEDLNLTREAIKNLCPEYAPTFEKVMNEHYYFYGNMMICKRKLLNEYCSWLFPILEYVEERTDLKKYDNKYQARVFGFLSERLIQVWVEHEKLKVIEFPVFNTEQKRMNFFTKTRNRIKHGIKMINSRGE